MKKLAWIFVYLIYFFTYSMSDNVTEYVHFSEGITMPATTVSTSESTSKPICHRLKGLSQGQMKHCLLYEDHMDSVEEGVKNSLAECQRQFKNHRWNCTAMTEHRTLFGPFFKFGHREAAFVQAIISAGVMHAIARSCRDGMLTRCGCSTMERPAGLYKDWIWRGCGDNLEYAYKFTRNLIDIREQEKIPRLKSNEKEHSRSLMALHNNEAGRRMVLKTTKVNCKCHGVSGSCSLITCWHQLPVFTEIGDFIKRKYITAIKVKKNKKGRLQIQHSARKRSKVTDLVYVHQSPNYCVHNETLGILGTEARECNAGSKEDDGSCDVLCCGRGFNTKKKLTKEKCNCKFHWCCHVQCDACISSKEIHSCK